MSRRRKASTSTPVVGDYGGNPAQRWLNARVERAEGLALARRGPLFRAAGEGRAAEATRRMDAAMARMEREGGRYELWGSGFAIEAVPDDFFDRRRSR